MLRQLSIKWLSYQRPGTPPNTHAHTPLPLILQPRQSSLSGVHFLKERMSLSDPGSVFSYISFCVSRCSAPAFHIVLKGCLCLNTLLSQVECIFSHCAHLLCFLNIKVVLFTSAAQNIEGRKRRSIIVFCVLCGKDGQSNKAGRLGSLPFWKITIRSVNLKPV